MPKLAILSTPEQRRFDSPTKFNVHGRLLYFSLNKAELDLVKALHKPTNKVGFTLQLGYFKAYGKFFGVEQFHQKDIEYVTKILNFSKEDLTTG